MSNTTKALALAWLVLTACGSEAVRARGVPTPAFPVAWDGDKLLGPSAPSAGAEPAPSAKGSGGGPASPAAAGATKGCRKDTDCDGELVCENGKCAAPR